MSWRTFATNLWAKVRQLTGRCNNTSSHSATVCPESLNDHYAAISTDRSYTTPATKCTAVIELRAITASIIQGSAIGPVSYVVTASDLYSVTPGNSLLKYADDTYVIIPATNIKSCPAEITNIKKWACNNNLRLNTSKSLEIIFVNPRSRIKATVPSESVSGFTQVEEIKMLGVTFSRKFSVSRHVNDLLSRCSQSLFAMRTLRQHGLPADALQVVYSRL